jgi:hypothetical protein
MHALGGRVIVGALATITLAAGCGGAAGVRVTSRELAPDSGAVVGVVVFDRYDPSAVLRVFTRQAVGLPPPLVASEVVRGDDGRFRFVLKPGNYYLVPACTQNRAGMAVAVDVRARRTTHVAIHAQCVPHSY